MKITPNFNSMHVGVSTQVKKNVVKKEKEYSQPLRGTSSGKKLNIQG
jgi:hypothetical protein